MVYQSRRRVRTSLLSFDAIPQRTKMPWYVIEAFPDIPADAVSSNTRIMSGLLKYNVNGDLPNLFADSLNTSRGQGNAVSEYGDFLRQLHDRDPKRAQDFEQEVHRKLPPSSQDKIQRPAETLLSPPTQPGKNLLAQQSDQKLRDRFMEFYPKLEGRKGNKYTNYPGDKGGPTKFGATQDEFNAYRSGKAKRASATPTDVKNLTREQAQKFFREHYYDRYRNGEIKDDRIAEHLFDITVNPGPKRSARWAQESINVIKGDKIIPEDGVMGSITIGALNDLSAGERQQVMDLVAEKRANHYRERAKVDTHVKEKLRGLLNRAYSFRLKKGKQ